MFSGKTYVRSKVSTDELLAGLAEEAAELAQAALKYRRAVFGTSPTPAKCHDAKDALLEEVADVLLYLEVLNVIDNVETPLVEIHEYMEAKGNRWLRRLLHGRD